MKKISVLIVDDSIFMRSVIRDFLVNDDELVVVGEAEDGEDALHQIQQKKPDVITLDLEMPKKSGVAVLAELQKFENIPKVLIVSSYAKDTAEITLNCLRMGADDFLLKPMASERSTLSVFGNLLIEKIKAAARSCGDDTSETAVSSAPTLPDKHKRHSRVVVIGSSTGGPVALEKIISSLPENVSFPIIVAQHLPELFVISLVKRFGTFSKLSIQVARDEMELEQSGIYFIPGGSDGMLIRNPQTKKVQFSIIKNQDEILTPSIDKLLISAASIFSEATTGIILTGMGKDGLLGARAVKAAGGTIIVQDQNSSAIFGMGKEVIEAGLADSILSLDQISKRLPSLGRL